MAKPGPDSGALGSSRMKTTCIGGGCTLQPDPLLYSQGQPVPALLNGIFNGRHISCPIFEDKKHPHNPPPPPAVHSSKPGAQITCPSTGRTCGSSAEGAASQTDCLHPWPVNSRPLEQNPLPASGSPSQRRRETAGKCCSLISR